MRFFTDNKKKLKCVHSSNNGSDEDENVIIKREKTKKNNKPIRVKSCEPQKRLRKWKNTFSIHFDTMAIFSRKNCQCFIDFFLLLRNAHKSKEIMLLSVTKYVVTGNLLF